MSGNGWKNLDEVWIPPIESEGFQEEIVIRKRIEPAAPIVKEEKPESVSVKIEEEKPESTPIIVEEEKTEPVSVKIEEEKPESASMIVEEEKTEPVQAAEAEEEVYDGEDATVLLSDPDEYDGEDATVLLAQEIVFTAYVERKSTGEKVCVDKERFIIGKSSSADYVIKDDKTISRKHAAISKTADGYYLEDLGSSNHTFVNGTQITEPVKLINHTMFQLSKEEFEFTLV